MEKSLNNWGYLTLNPPGLPRLLAPLALATRAQKRKSWVSREPLKTRRRGRSREHAAPGQVGGIEGGSNV